MIALGLLLSAGAAQAEGTVNEDVRSILKNGHLAELRWGHFSDVAKPLTQLYGETADPVWFSLLLAVLGLRLLAGHAAPAAGAAPVSAQPPRSVA